jgi:hypothetical protein
MDRALKKVEELPDSRAQALVAVDRDLDREPDEA